MSGTLRLSLPSALAKFAQRRSAHQVALDVFERDASLHRDLQFLHRHPAIARGERARFLVKTFFADEPIYGLAVGGVSMLLAGLFTLRIPDRSSLALLRATAADGRRG